MADAFVADSVFDPVSAWECADFETANAMVTQLKQLNIRSYVYPIFNKYRVVYNTDDAIQRQGIQDCQVPQNIGEYFEIHKLEHGFNVGLAVVGLVILGLLITRR